MPQIPDSDLLARLEAAEAAVRARDDFLAIAAHELRSPLNALALRLAALERMAAAAGTGQLQAEVERTRRMVDRYVRRSVVLLDVSRLQQQEQQPLARDWVDMRQVVQDVVEAHRDEALFRGATLDARVETDARGFWEPHMIEEILSNLVSNAIKYGQGSPVQVRASLRDPATACLEVSDQGPGIPPDQCSRIFEKFERLVSTARDRAGFGLGLWIVGRMVAAHHGTIDVASRPGGGTLFRVLLPLDTAIASQENDRT